MPVTTIERKPGDVLNYRPEGRFMPDHCREGVAIVNEHGRALDTFWGFGGERHVLSDEEMEGAILRFRLGEYRKLGADWDRKHGEWMTYAPADRQVITSQHRLQAVYYVRIGAEPHFETQIANAREAVEEAERKAASAQRSVEWAEEDLARLEAKRA